MPVLQGLIIIFHSKHMYIRLGIYTNKIGDCLFIYLFITSLAKEVMFLVALVCLFVCLFVCGQHYSKS